MENSIVMISTLSSGRDPTPCLSLLGCHLIGLGYHYITRYRKHGVFIFVLFWKLHLIQTVYGTVTSHSFRIMTSYSSNALRITHYTGSFWYATTSLRQKRKRSSGWQRCYSLETLKLVFNVSSEYQGCHPDDISASVYDNTVASDAMVPNRHQAISSRQANLYGNSVSWIISRNAGITITAIEAEWRIYASVI